jgi:CHAT domain-containing protein/Tfp pilus assembly protein PilF
MKKYLFLSLIIFTSHWLNAQQVIASADSLILNSEYEKAIALLDRNTNPRDPSLTFLIKNKKAEAYTRLGKFNEAEKILKELSGETNQSLLLQAITKTNQGFLYLNQGRNDLALELLSQALDQFNKQSKSNTLEAAQAMTYLGLVYKSTNKQAQAEEQLQMALTIRQNLLKGDHELIAASYNDLGFAYAQANNDVALEYYEKALAIYKKLHGNEHPKIAIASTNIGFIYRELVLYGDAVNNLESSLKIWEKVYSQAHPSKAFVLFNLGKTYMAMGNLQAARGYYDRALEMYKTSYAGKHPEISNVLNAIAGLELGAEKYDNAIRLCQQALLANVPDFESSDPSRNPELKNFYHGNVLLNSLLLKAESLEARHMGKTLKFSDLELALQTLQRCDSLIDMLRQQSTNESDKIALGVTASEVYADGVRIAYEASTVAFHKSAYRELAFYFAEKSKSAVLLEAISESDAKSFAGIPAPLLEEEKNLKSAIALTAQKLAQKPTAEEEKYLRETSFSLNRTYESFVKRLETEFPDYFNLKFNAALPSISQLQNLIDDKTALISYFVDEKKERLYIFSIARSSFKIADHSLAKDFDKYITGLRNGVYFNVLPAYKEAAQKLYELLIPRLPSQISSLVIIPTGRLSIVPFETLLTKQTGSEDFSTLPYLLNEFSIRYEFSAGLLLQKAKQSVNKTTSIFLCAPIKFPEKDNLAELPATESEVAEISRLFAAKNIRSSIFTGQDANEHLVKGNGLKDYSYIHFATHGVVDENDPQLSRIFLQTNNEAEDGNLFAGEIYNLEMNANLVTLSACQTGLGKISKGEGVIGLSRALVYAGAKNIVVSFWSVADESTSELMKVFYKSLLDTNSTDYSANLRQAKLSLLRDKKYAAPYYWAPFILIGF